MDDTYAFNSDGSFVYELGVETFLEPWQHGGEDEKCGAPIAPFDGSQGPYTYSLDFEAGKLTVYGTGAFIGLPKVKNGADFTGTGSPPEQVIYDITY